MGSNVEDNGIKVQQSLESELDELVEEFEPQPPEPDEKARAKKPRKKKDEAREPNFTIPPKPQPRQAHLDDAPYSGGDQTAIGTWTKIRRTLMPAGWRGHPSEKAKFIGNAGWYEKHDLREVLEHIESTWGGGTYRLEFFTDGVESLKAREETVSGDPLPLREDDDEYEPPYRGGRFYDDTYRAPGPLGGPYQAPGGPGYPPLTPGVVPSQAWAQPRETDEVRELRARVAKAEREAERKEQERREAEREARLEARLAALSKPAVDPLQPFMQMMAEQAKAQAARQEREDREARDRRDREERERKEREERIEKERREREEKEEARRREERAEQQRREDKEEQRRREERKEREAREERLAKEQREFMTAMASANSPEKMLAMLSSIQKLTAPATDPVEQLIRLKEAEGILKDGDGDDKEEGMAEKVAGTLNNAAAAAAAYFEAKKGSQPVNIGELQQVQQQGHAPQQLPPPRRGPPPPPAHLSEEAKIGRALVLFRFVGDQYKVEAAPEDTAMALLGFAKGLEENHPGIVTNLIELSSFAAMPQEQVAALLGGLSMNVTNQSHAKTAAEVSAMVADPKGFAWLQAVLNNVATIVGAA